KIYFSVCMCECVHLCVFVCACTLCVCIRVYVCVHVCVCVSNVSRFRMNSPPSIQRLPPASWILTHSLSFLGSTLSPPFSFSLSFPSQTLTLKVWSTVEYVRVHLCASVHDITEVFSILYVCVCVCVCVCAQ